MENEAIDCPLAILLLFPWGFSIIKEKDSAMPNHSSTQKSLRKDNIRRLTNQSRISALRTLVKKVRTDYANAGALQSAQKAFDSAASKGTLHKRTAARKVSRLMRAAHKATVIQG